MFHGTFIDNKDFDDITMREKSLTEIICSMDCLPAVGDNRPACRIFEWVTVN